jgi:hypothetical protein
MSKRSTNCFPSMIPIPLDLDTREQSDRGEHRDQHDREERHRSSPS